MIGNCTLSHSGHQHALLLLLLSFATLFCSSNAAFPYPKPFPTATSNALRYPIPYVMKRHTRSGHDGRNHSWLKAASSPEQTAKRSSSDAMSIALVIPYGGETANNGAWGVNIPHMTSEQCGVDRDESRRTVEAAKREKIVKVTFRLHLYVAAMYECNRNPSITPAVLITALCQFLLGEGKMNSMLVVLVGSSVLDHVTEGFPLRQVVSLLLAMSAIEAAVLWVHFKSLDINDVLLLIPVLISLFVMKN